MWRTENSLARTEEICHLLWLFEWFQDNQNMSRNLFLYQFLATRKALYNLKGFFSIYLTLKEDQLFYLWQKGIADYIFLSSLPPYGTSGASRNWALNGSTFDLFVPWSKWFWCTRVLDLDLCQFYDLINSQQSIYLMLLSYLWFLDDLNVVCI